MNIKTALLAITIISLANVVDAQSFRDNFDDGDFADGRPVTWVRTSPPFERGELAIEGDDLIITPPNSGASVAANYWETAVFAEDLLYHDVTFHTQVRAMTDGLTLVGIGALDTEATDGPAGSGVWGNLTLDANQQYVSLAYSLGPSPFVNLGRVPTQLSHITEDINLKMTISGLDVAFSVWPAGFEEPATPTIAARLPLAFEDMEGHVTAFAGNRSEIVPVAFRFFDVQNVPEPRCETFALGLLCSLGFWRRRFRD